MSSNRRMVRRQARLPLLSAATVPVGRFLCQFPPWYSVHHSSFLYSSCLHSSKHLHRADFSLFSNFLLLSKIHPKSPWLAAADAISAGPDRRNAIPPCGPADLRAAVSGQRAAWGPCGRTFPYALMLPDITLVRAPGAVPRASAGIIYQRFLLFVSWHHLWREQGTDWWRPAVSSPKACGF